jgi:hypothetical protein
MRRGRGDIFSIKMKLKDQVVSLKLARELKELGMEQDSVWIWVKTPCRDSGYECTLSWNSDPYLENYSAHTVAELGKMLPSGFYSYYDAFDGWTCSSPRGFCDIPFPNNRMYSSNTLLGPCVPARQCRYSEEAKTEVDARAKMLISLKKKGLI